MSESTVEGADRLAATLGRFASELDNLTTAGEKSGQAVKIRASQLAPVDTGNLARSIRADSNGTTVEVGTSVPYGRFQEYGTVYVTASPYLRPALDQATNQITAAYLADIQEKLSHVKGA